MRAEIVSVGTELLLGQIADTNAQHLGRLLPQLGISHTHRQTVGDNMERLVEALRLALSRADIVITIGGLGPTEDDITREAIANALGDETVVDEACLASLRQWFRERNLPWVESQASQAVRPMCGVLVENPNGTAPGLICERAGKIVIALPGPKGEFVPMADGPVRDYLSKLARGEVIHSRVLRICGLGESVVEDRIRPLLASSNPSVAPYAHPGEVHLRLTAAAPTIELAEALIRPAEQRVREVLGDAVYGADDVTLEQSVIELLKAQGYTLAVAESVTGGGLGARLTSVAGSGEVYVGGVVAYDPKVKHELLGVSMEVLEDESRGPVSAECAEQMAAGVKKLLHTDYGLSVTGNAGPTADKGDKPIGMTYIAVVGPGGGEVREHLFRGGRELVRVRAQQAGLTMMREHALGPSRDQEVASGS